MYKVNNYGGTLYLIDEPILRFKYRDSDLVELELFDFDPKRLPFELAGVKINQHYMDLFLKNRTVPPTRIGLKESLAKTPIPYYDRELLLRYSRGRECNDKFWIDPDRDTTSLEGIVHPVFYSMFTGNSK